MGANSGTARCNPTFRQTQGQRWQHGETARIKYRRCSMNKYNLRSIMRAAWRLYRSGTASFSLALRIAWANEKARHAAQEAAGIAEETHTGQAGRSWAMKSAIRARQYTRPPLPTPPPRAAHARLPTLGAPRFIPSAHKKSPLPESRPKQQARD